MAGDNLAVQQKLERFLPDRNSSYLRSPLSGYLIFLFSAVFFVGTIFALLISKIESVKSTCHVFNWIGNDFYYSYLVPTTVVPTLIVKFLCYISFQVYRHS
mmetsp:Transcript_26681/g.41873  ORF Transcript_26681/g.41873 Transcript_26681/m.41873 type:complete len:101 (+) Transcript_26681:124-426(+)